MRICESVLRDIYGQEDLDKPTSAYEQCGAWSSPDEIIMPVDPDDWTKGYTIEQDDPVLIYPEKAYANAEEFFANFPQMSIPFMGDFAI